MLKFLRKNKKILGINERNLKYLSYSRAKKAKIDNKLEAKKFLKRIGLPLPKTIAKIESFKDLTNFDFDKLDSNFVIKPNQGFGGKGIVIVFGKKKNKNGDAFWIKSGKTRIDKEWIKNHMIHILDGRFSLSGRPDTIFIEERIKIPKFLKPFSYLGIPDIRVIVYNSIPVMAMLRLPTKFSEGKANLHLGAIGAGIDLASGKTINAILKNKIIKFVPETRYLLNGIQIPEWKKILEIAVIAQMASGIKYVGVDIAIDREKGPLVLELNARPGLSIQLANLAPLKERLERIDGLEVNNHQRSVIIAQQLFGSEFGEEFIEEISGKRIIGINEPIEIFDNRDGVFKTIAKIDTGAYRSAICSSIAEKLSILKPVKFKNVKSSLGAQKRPIIKLSFVLDKKPITTEAYVIDRTEMKFDCLIGRKDLKQFFVDPRKNTPINKKLTLKKSGAIVGEMLYKIKGLNFYIIKTSSASEEGGMRLMKHFLKKLKKERGKKILIETEEKNIEKRKLLESCGFSEKERKENIVQFQRIIK